MRIENIGNCIVTVEFYETDILRITQALTITGLLAEGSHARPEHFNMPTGRDRTAADWYEQTAQALNAAAFAAYLNEYIPRTKRPPGDVSHFVKHNAKDYGPVWHDSVFDQRSQEEEDAQTAAFVAAMDGENGCSA